MTFPDPIVLKDTLSDLKDIVSRSQGDDNECVRLLGQIEALVSEIERKALPTVAVQSQAPIVAAAATNVTSVTM